MAVNSSLANKETSVKSVKSVVGLNFMEIEKILESKQIPNPVQKFEKELLQVFDAASPAGKVVAKVKKMFDLEGQSVRRELLTVRTAEIGLLLLDAHPSMKKEKHGWSPIRPVNFDDERYRRLKTLFADADWQDAEFANLLVFFFGAEKTDAVRRAWERIRFEMYQTGYVRRSFRAPEAFDLYFLNQLNFLVNLIPQVFRWGSYPKYEHQYFDLNIAEQIKYGFYFQHANLFRLWAAALDLGNREVFAQMEDIIFNRDEVGKVTREIIKALLNSENRDAWQLVEKLLLAAQRQEGLRQTILEALDETSVGGLKYMIGVILEHKLTRFSSVVRAVDVWAGFGWESEREKTVNSFLEKAHDFLTAPEKIPSAIKSENNADVYMALWAQGIFDIEKTRPFLEELYAHATAEKRALALKFAYETKHAELSLPLFEKGLDDADLTVLAWALTGLQDFVGEYSRHKTETDKYPALFDKLRRIVETVETKQKLFEGEIFAWTRIVFNRDDALSMMIDLIGDDAKRLDYVLNYFAEMSVTLREKMTRKLLPDHLGYYRTEKKKPAPLSDFQREFAFRLLSDRGEFMVRAGFEALQNASFSDDEINVLQTLLKRKGADFRGRIIALLLAQTDAKIGLAVTELMTKGDGEQRLAGLDILLQLKKKKRLAELSEKLVADFTTKRKISPKEEILVAQLTEKAEQTKDFTAANGYGLYDVKKSVSPVIAPVIDAENIYEKRFAKNEYAFSRPLKEIRNALGELAKIYLANKDFEYEVEQYDGSRQTVLLGNVFRSSKNNPTFETGRELFESYPLFEVWEKWFADSGLDEGDLEIIALSTQFKFKNQIPEYEDVFPPKARQQYSYNNPLHQIIEALQTAFPFAQRDEFLLGGCTRLFASLDDSVLKHKPKERTYYWSQGGDGWQSDLQYQAFFYRLLDRELKDDLAAKLRHLAHWRQFSGRAENIEASLPSLMTFGRAFELGVIGEDELLRGLLTAENCRVLSGKKGGRPIYARDEFDYFERFKFLKPLFEKLREHFLDIELKRGDSPTSVTNFVANFQTIYGTRRFVEILTGLGKTPLNKGYYYYYGGQEVNKQHSFSRLLKNCRPLESDTQAEFNKLVKSAGISEKRLIESAVYAPQWQKFVSGFLNWKGLDSAVWWMHAHTKIAGYQEQNAEAESEIAKYSAVDLQDFKDGAVDKDWFLGAYKTLGKARWEIIYDAAKYISDGNGHRRARLYADVISGQIKTKEIAGRVKDKRDQDYLRIYGLAPLGKTNPEREVLARYEYFQKFKKESRQFGAQKQSSEALALRIALENLARNAGFADPVRLTWAMETKQVQKILSGETEIRAGETCVKLVIDDEGKAEIITRKGEKELKSIPSAFKKDSRFLELTEHRKTLREQLSRSRRALEEAMVRGDEFETAELQTLFEHPIISKHLEKLVFVSGAKHGFYENGQLVSAAAQTFVLNAEDKIRLAHCVDLYESGAWGDYQRTCFERQLKQPFKQIFRELYVPTEDELRAKSVSRRYAGHQIQPKKTLALLKTRGWKIDYEEGLQKVFHKEGFTAKMYALADWFSPAEIESPTLETVEFQDLKTYQTVAFETIGARIFSEVMRDIDLVVSVAHAGGVDPEASHSTVEMRSAILREIVRLFQLENVEISGTHVRIKGSLSEYSVHLGSAVVHLLPGKYLSILPVHSQQRGRLFLPFADDDPKTAEVMSKVLLLARDNEIQDPTILRQIN